MSEVLNSLNVPEVPTKSWADEVAEAGAAEPTAAAPEPVSADPAPSQPEPQEPAYEAPEPQETADRRVPLKALQEERQKRAEYERQVQDYQRQLAEYQAWAAEMQRQQMMGHNGGPQMEQEAPEPDPETDPIGALKYERERARRLQDAIRQQQEAAQQQAYVQQLNQVAYQAATDYQARTPDYQDAYRYALNSRAQELAALGTPPQQIGQILQREELSLIDAAVRNGRNPAEAIYHFAKARGFQGKQAAPAPVAQAPDPVMQQQKAAVAASASAGGAPASKGQLTPADIANLRGAAFDKAWQKIEEMSGKKSSIFRD